MRNQFWILMFLAFTAAACDRVHKPLDGLIPDHPVASFAGAPVGHS